jgi:RimJ/RimL family protein N-acetyltransferase
MTRSSHGVFLETERLSLRRFTHDDVDNLVELDSDPQVMRYITGGRATPREEIEHQELPAFLRTYGRNDGFGFWAAVEKSTGTFLGWFHLRPPADGPPDEPELGYRLRRAAWGNGYASEGSRALVEKAFADLGARRVWAETMAVNVASRRVMEKAGLRYVRTFHQDWPYEIEGSEEGDVEYALTRAEWESARDAVRVAARNNAEWCDAFCRTHVIAGRFDEDAWWSAERTPPLYPDAVTLVPGADAASILSRVDAGPGCSIKDSFGDLDLTPYALEVLFRAEWLRLEAVRSSIAPTGWSAISAADELRDWEAAWGVDARAFFLPALLTDERIAILARYEGDRVVAGAIANRSDAAIGLSNVFAVGRELESAYVGAASAAEARWGSLPVVGYEFGPSLEAARRAEFATIGDLAVWARPARDPIGL